MFPGLFAALNRFLTKFIAALFSYDIWDGDPDAILVDLSITRMTSTGAGVDTPVTCSVTLNWLQIFDCVAVLFNVICPDALFAVIRPKIRRTGIVIKRQIVFENRILNFIAKVF
jgi:hypothetical protein